MILLAIDFLESNDDKRLIEKIYNEYMAWFRKRAHRFSVNDTVCEDIAQECILNVITYIDSVRDIPERQLPFYLATVLDNTAIDYMKKENKTVSAQCKEVSLFDFIPDDTNIENEVERKYTYEAMKESYEILPQRDKELIFLRYGMDMKDDAIANIAKIGKSSVRMTIYRSVMKLKNNMKKEELL